MFALLAMSGGTVVAAETQLIPRSAIFGNPQRAGAQLSPNGKTISFLAPRDGVMNVWVVARGQSFETAKPLTNEKVRPIRSASWSESGAEILFTQDKGGDENFLLYAVNPETGVERKLTDFQGVRVLIYGSSHSRPDEMVVGINDRDKAFHDPYLLNIRTGKLERLFENKQRYSSFVVDDKLAIRFATRSMPDGGFEFLSLDGAQGKVIDTIPFEDGQTTGPQGMTTDGKILNWVESRGRDKAALYEVEVATGAKRLVGEDSKADVSRALTHPSTGKITGYGVNFLKNEWRGLDKDISADFSFLSANLKGQWAVQSQTESDRVWLIGNDPVTSPSRVLVFDRDTRSLTELYVSRPALVNAKLPDVCPVEIKSRDQQTLVSYLTLPVGSGENCKPKAPLPLVLNVHGGPWARDQYGYNPESTWFADRGYASLQVNFRGSTGFGKSFVNGADLEWGRKMHFDLIDAIDWAIANGVADPKRIAIYGGSYGGYAALWGATNTPDRFACAVAIVAPSNLKTLLSTVPPYWESFKNQMYRRVGDPRTPEGSALLDERSPLTHVSKISRPLLIGQGANDPRVKQAEADQIVSAMKARKIPLTYVLYPDEGHGFARPANRTSFYAVSEAFLSKCLGGKFEEVGSDFKGSTIQVPEGADNVPGLRAAISP
jgi:dipeptidyl aminopeptidase/acylaminoacyl peptidase